jgi:glycosyltransferase involved in cell wall biosynthesis
VAILLSTYNGSGYLTPQLDSFIAQTHPRWTLYWRDDGSADATPALLTQFAARAGNERCVQGGGGPARLGIADSFLALLRTALPTLAEGDAVAFADQDDVWLPEKLARGMSALAEVPPGVPALYCARQVLVDEHLQQIGLSPEFNRPPGFPAALTQNIATGCTILLNHAAATLIGGSRPLPGTLHDWWSYMLIAGAGGVVLTDDAPVLLYRQHPGNAVGAQRSRIRRAMAAARRGPGPFMTDFRRHLDSLAAHEAVLTASARQDIAVLRQAVAGGMRQRMAALNLPGLRRNHWSEGMLFRLWFMIG